MLPSHDTLTSRQAPFFQLACFGALSRELRHETNNLLAVAGAWAGYRTSSDLTSLSPLLDKSADAVSRLTSLERAIGMCALHKNGLQRDDSLVEIFMHARTILAPRFRVAGMELIADVAADRVAGPTGPWVLALTLLMRHSIEAMSATDARSLTVTTDVGAKSVELFIEGKGVTQGNALFSPSPSAIDGPEFWAGPGLAVAKHCIGELGGNLSVDATNSRYILLAPRFAG